MAYKKLLKSLGIGSKTPPSHSRNPSPAQLCPEDILRIIYYDTSRSDCARGARVWRGWHEACIGELYRTFPHSEVHLDSSSGRLIHHLHNSKALRSRVRSIEISMILRGPSNPTRHILKPLVPLFTPDLAKSPSPSYLCLHGRWHLGRAPRMIAKSGIIRQVSHLDLRYNRLLTNSRMPTSQKAVHYKAALRAILPAASSIDSLSASLLSMTHKSISINGYPSLFRPIPLRRLSLFIHVLGREVLPLLMAVTSTLQQLHIDLFAGGTKDPERDACVQAISKMHNLVELMIVTEESASTTPFLEEILPHLPNLRYLFCGKGTFTIALLDVLPPSLEGLYFAGHDHTPSNPFRSGESPYNVIRQILLILASNQTKMPYLRHLYWWMHVICALNDNPPAAAVELDALAKEVDIGFQYELSYYGGMLEWGMEASLQPHFSLESKMPSKPAPRV